jgi:hypothetical protein
MTRKNRLVFVWNYLSWGGAQIYFLSIMKVARQAWDILVILPEASSPETESTYSGAWYEWDGDVVAKDFVLYPYDEVDPETEIRFERIHLETPGWFWVLRNVLDRKLRRVKLDQIHLTLTNGSSAAGIEPTLGDLGPIGPLSASPFEAEGCIQDNTWVREELEEMGLVVGENRLEFDYQVVGKRLNTRIVLETEGVSRVTLTREGELPQAINALMLDSYPSLTRSERFEVQDEGFVSARNKFCTKKDGIDLRRYIERHVESVERLMETIGFGLDPDSRIAYRRFVRDGGTLAFGGEYGQPLHIDEFYDLRDSGEVLSRMNARIEHNRRSNPVVWRRFTPRPLPGLDRGEPTYAALQQEHMAQLRGDPAPVATPAPEDSPTAPTADATATQPETATGTATRVAAPAPAPAPADAVSDTSATPADAPQDAATLPATIAPDSAPPATPPTAPTTAAPSAPATATVPAAAASAGTPPSAPAPTRRGARLDWASLPNYRGRLVRIWTMHNPPRTVEILSGNAASIRVSARLGGGNAEYTIQREGFLRATLVH